MAAFAGPTPAIPILMFHKVVDAPRAPEDISPKQLDAVLRLAWQSGFCPVNMTDILTDRVDAVVPRGLKPLGITADDSHPSILFSRETGDQSGNSNSFVDVFRGSLVSWKHAPRATFFCCGAYGTEGATSEASYFGGRTSLAGVLNMLASLPGLELAYHTHSHTRMKGMGASEVKGLLKEQESLFQRWGVVDRIARILAYPYGVAPKEDGIRAVADMGFLGAVLAFPGIQEARYSTLPQCSYDRKLISDPFLIPRVNIGAFMYAPGVVTTTMRYAPIDPVADFRKDVAAIAPEPYVSKG